MQVVEELTAQMFVDQLSPRERASVERVLLRLGQAKNLNEVSGIKRLATSKLDKPVYYTIPVGHDLRVVFYVEDNRIVVVDVIRRSQLRGLELGRRFR
jgi:hypothetical protein